VLKGIAKNNSEAEIKGEMIARSEGRRYFVIMIMIMIMIMVFY